ncbi:MAG: hypothetical protein ABFD83_04885 [Armatimonadota bacterium]
MKNARQDQNYFDMTEPQRAVYHANERKECAKAALNANTIVAELNRTISRRESAIMADVCAEQNGDGKPVYSNDAARKAERDRRIESDAVIVAAREELEKKQLLAQEASIDAAYHTDMLRIYCAFAQSTEVA